MQMKTCTEQYLKESGLNYTIFRLCGFMQVMPLLLVFTFCVCTGYSMCVIMVCRSSKVVYPQTRADLHQHLSEPTHELQMFWSVRLRVGPMCRLSLVTMQFQFWRTSRCGEPATIPALHTWTAKMLLEWHWRPSGISFTSLPVLFAMLLQLIRGTFGCAMTLHSTHA